MFFRDKRGWRRNRKQVGKSKKEIQCPHKPSLSKASAVQPGSPASFFKGIATSTIPYPGSLSPVFEFAKESPDPLSKNRPAARFRCVGSRPTLLGWQNWSLSYCSSSLYISCTAGKLTVSFHRVNSLSYQVGNYTPLRHRAFLAARFLTAKVPVREVQPASPAHWQ